MFRNLHMMSHGCPCFSAVCGHDGTHVLVWMELTVDWKKRETEEETDPGITQSRMRNRKGDTNCKLQPSNGKQNAEENYVNKLTLMLEFSIVSFDCGM